MAHSYIGIVSLYLNIHFPSLSHKFIFCKDRILAQSHSNYNYSKEIKEG
jgi:hypothetical protein